MVQLENCVPQHIEMFFSEKIPRKLVGKYGSDMKTQLGAKTLCHPFEWEDFSLVFS